MVQTSEIFIVRNKCVVFVVRGFAVKQSRLSEEDGFNLEQVVPVFAASCEWDGLCPLLKSIPIDAEPEVVLASGTTGSSSFT